MTNCHILHTESSLGWGGQEIRIFRESIGLLKRGHRVSLLCQPQSLLAERAKQEGLPVYLLKMRGPLQVHTRYQFYRLIKKISPDIIHTHSSADSWLTSPIAKLCKIPLIRSRHLTTPVAKYFPSRLIYTYFPDRIITSGTKAAEILLALQGMDSKKIVPVPLGVDLVHFHVESDTTQLGASIRRELNIGFSAPLIGIVAVLRSWKGHQDFLAAAEPIIRHIPEARFLIVGEGPQRKNIEAAISLKNLNRAVILTGHREDIPQILASLDCLVLPSTGHEASSQIIPQAFAMKVPVVATTAGGNVELVKEGVTGLLVPPRSPEALAAAIIKIISTPSLARRCREQAYGFVTNSLTFEQSLAKTIEVYEGLLK